MYSNDFDGHLQSETIVSCLKLHAKNYQNLDVIMRNKLIVEPNQTINLRDFNQLMDVLCYQTKSRPLVPKTTKYPRLVWLQNCVLNPYFDHIGNFIAVVNVITLSVEITLYPGYCKTLKLFN